jgi:hypothetical protein
VVLERRIEALACENECLTAKLESRSRDVEALEGALGVRAHGTAAASTDVSRRLCASPLSAQRWRGLPGSGSSFSHLPPLSGPSSRPSSPVMGVPATRGAFAKQDVPARVGLSEVSLNKWRR